MAINEAANEGKKEAESSCDYVGRGEVSTALTSSQKSEKIASAVSDLAGGARGRFAGLF